MPIAATQGSARAGAVLCVHGTPGDHRMFRRLAALAPADVLFASLDLPDHGASADEPALDLAPFERDLVAAVGSLPPVPVTLVGNSFGAVVVARVLAGLGARIARAVFLGGFAALPPALAAGHAQLGTAIDGGQLDLAAVESLAFDLFLGGEGTPDDATLIHSIIRDSGRPRLVRSCGRLARLTDLTIAPFETPAFVLHARDDQAIPFALAPAFAACGADTKIVPVAGRSHCLHLTHARVVADVVYGA